MRKECTYVQLECDYKLFCGFEFDNEYGWNFSDGYDKIDREATNDKLRYMNS